MPDAESQAGAEDEKRMQLIAHARKILEDDMKRRATPKPQTPKPQRCLFKYNLKNLIQKMNFFEDSFQWIDEK